MLFSVINLTKKNIICEGEKYCCNSTEMVTKLAVNWAITTSCYKQLICDIFFFLWHFYFQIPFLFGEKSSENHFVKHFALIYKTAHLLFECYNLVLKSYRSLKYVIRLLYELFFLAIVVAKPFMSLSWYFK